MKKIAFYSLLVFVAITFAGCSSTKYVPYFQNADTISLAPSRMLYDAKIMPKDQLTITVSASNPEAVTPFNLGVSGINTSGSTTVNRLSTSQSTLLPYLVDNEGCINFPVIGKIHVEGLTKTECQNMIQEKIMPYLNIDEKPIVTVQMSSYRITVMGEVNRPCVVPVSTEKISILEALAQAGDLSIYGRRENVMLIREDRNGEKSIHRMNLNDANIINSPYYYLQQNDVIYVEPNKAKAKNSDIGQSTTLMVSVTSILISIASLIVNIVR